MKSNLSDLCPCNQKKRPSEDRHPESDSGSKDRGAESPRNNWGYPKVEEVRKGPPPEPSEGVWPHQYADFGLLASATVREKICCWKPSSS